MSDRGKPGISHVPFTEGPFVVIVTDPSDPEDKDYPFVVAPDGGFPTREAAEQWVDLYKGRKEPYVGLHFIVTVLRSQESFMRFCSWED